MLGFNRFILITIVLLTQKAYWCSAKNWIDLRIEKDGEYAIIVENSVWFQSGIIFVRHNGEEFNTADKSLSVSVDSASTTTGIDQTFGNFVQYKIDYSTKEYGELMNGFIKIFADAVIFEQYFPVQLNDTSTGNADSTITSFPSFSFQQFPPVLGYSQWVSWYYDHPESSAGRRKALVALGFETPHFGILTNESTLAGGIGGSGCICVFDVSDRSSFAAVLSPLDNFMSVSHVSRRKGSLDFGFMGNISAITKDTSMKTLLHFDRGINKAMKSWGDRMRQYYSKAAAAVARHSDVTLQYLGFTTDNGAFYYYHTDEEKDYEQTLVAVKEYADFVGLPYKYVLLDSWWYFRGENGGVSEWAARPEVFLSGLVGLYEKTGWLVQAHNRYWAQDVVYAKQNGGQYEFLFDSERDGAVPTDPAFWDNLFAKSSAWGLRVYEQDWLFNEFYEYVGPMLSSLSLGRTWLLQMGSAAHRAGITVQYCMPFVRHLLQSLELPAGRASDDYVVMPYEGVDNWRIGGQSILIDALGLAPSKDGFWSTISQPGNPYGDDKYAPCPRLHAAVATISAGPIAIADGIGYSDVALVMRSCMKDGRLLQPSAPAKLIDACFLRRATAETSSLAADRHTATIGMNLPDGELWFAPSDVGTRRFGTLFVADLSDDWLVRPSDLDFDMKLPTSAQFWAFEANMTSNVLRFSEVSPLLLKACGVADFSLLSLVPIESNNWALMGEMSKWVGVSPTRFVRITVLADGMSVSVQGVNDETISVGFVNPQGNPVVVRCTFGLAGRLDIFSNGRCLT